MAKNKKDIEFSQIYLMGFELSGLGRLIRGAFIIGILAAIYGAHIIERNTDELLQFISFLNAIQCFILIVGILASFACKVFKDYGLAIKTFRLILPAPLLVGCLSAQLFAWALTGFDTAHVTTMINLAISVCITMIHIHIARETIEEIKKWGRKMVDKTEKGRTK